MVVDLAWRCGVVVNSHARVLIIFSPLFGGGSGSGKVEVISQTAPDRHSKSEDVVASSSAISPSLVGSYSSSTVSGKVDKIASISSLGAPVSRSFQITFALDLRRFSMH
jgi:hypothetical protein